MKQREEPSDRPAGGRLLRNQLFEGNRAQAGPNTISVTDGNLSPDNKEPQKVILTFEELLEKKHLCEASQLLIEREECLFEEITEAGVLKHWEEEVERLGADRRTLKDLVVQILKQSLSTEVNAEALTSAVRAVCQEEEQDQHWKQRGGTLPAWRPSGWKKLHDSTLCSLVEERMDNTSSSPPADLVEKSSLEVDIYSMGRQLKQDLLLVVEKVKSCYPPELNICDSYARWYHQTISASLRNIVEFGLDDKDCTFILLWVNEYYPEILRKPELVSEIDHEALGKLLPENLLEPLEKQFFRKQQNELTTWINRVLEEAKKKWEGGEEPLREDGCFVSPVDYDFILLINSIVATTVKVVGDQSKAQNLTYQLKDLLQRLRIFQEDIMKRSKPNSKSFIKAILSCVEHFRDFLDKNRNLFPEDVWERCLSVLMDMKQSAHMYLLSPVHKALMPQYRKLGTNDWLNKSTFENLLVSIEREIQDLQSVAKSCHKDLMGQLHQEVTVEYVKRLLSGVKPKNKEHQTKACMAVTNDAESLHNLFVENGSEEYWLKEILNKIAELLELQDLPAIQLQVVFLGRDYPDFSEKHLSPLLRRKSHLTRSDREAVKIILSDTLILCQSNPFSDARPFFYRVPI